MGKYVWSFIVSFYIYFFPFFPLLFLFFNNIFICSNLFIVENSVLGKFALFIGFNLRM